MSTRKFMVIGGQIDRIAAAYRMNTDLVCLDLEDTVPEDRKSLARNAVEQLVSLGQRHNIASSVRISPLSTEDGLKDLLLLRALPRAPNIIVLSKTEDPHEVRLAQQLLLPRHPQMQIQAIIETAAALLKVEEIAAQPGLHSISLGGKDLSESLRIARSWDALLYARGRCAAAAAAADIPIVDGPQPPSDDLDSFRELCKRLKHLGFSGKSAISEEHLAVISEVWQN